MSDNGEESDENIKIWKIKKLIKSLEVARGNGTSMISLIMPPHDQISRVTKMLNDEYRTASNIKSRLNRQINFRDSATNAELEVEEKMTLLEWFVDEYKKFGCTLEFVTNKF